MICHSNMMVGSSTLTGRDIKDMWSVLLCYTYMGCGIYYIAIGLYDELDMWSVICLFRTYALWDLK